MHSKNSPETIETRIESLAAGGDGIGRTPDGRALFVPLTAPRDRVRVRIVESRSRFARGVLEAVIEPSPDRVEPACAVFGRCGGCALQHVSEQQQQSIKFQTLKDNLERIGKVTPDAWLPPIIGPNWHYRRRARLGVKDVPGKGRVLVGFRERHAPFITDMHRCEVLAKPVDGMIDGLSTLIGSLSIRARLPQIEVAVAENAVALVFRVLDPPTDEDTALLWQFGEANNVRIYLQPAGLDSVVLLYPDAPVEALFYTLPEFDIRIEFSPVGFVQINSDINEQMVRNAIELLASCQGIDRV